MPPKRLLLAFTKLLLFFYGFNSTLGWAAPQTQTVPTELYQAAANQWNQTAARGLTEASLGTIFQSPEERAYLHQILQKYGPLHQIGTLTADAQGIHLRLNGKAIVVRFGQLTPRRVLTLNDRPLSLNGDAEHDFEIVSQALTKLGLQGNAPHSFELIASAYAVHSLIVIVAVCLVAIVAIDVGGTHWLMHYRRNQIEEQLALCHSSPKTYKLPENFVALSDSELKTRLRNEKSATSTELDQCAHELRMSPKPGSSWGTGLRF